MMRNVKDGGRGRGNARGVGGERKDLSFFVRSKEARFRTVPYQRIFVPSVQAIISLWVAGWWGSGRR